MSSIVELTAGRPSLKFSAGDILVGQGEGGGDLFILLSGSLNVVRDGVTITTISQPGTVIGEMSVLLGTATSATVTAAQDATVRVVRDAKALLDSEPALARALATLVAGRLDATSALLVELSQKHKGGSSGLGQILASLHVPAWR